MKKSGLNIITVLVLLLGIVGCVLNSKQQAKFDGNDIFIQTFQASINKKWSREEDLEIRYKKDPNFTEEKYSEETIKILESEVSALEKRKVKIEDKNLKSNVENYIKGLKKQIEANKTNDFELREKYLEESDELINSSLVTIVDDYDVEINDEYKETYKEFKENI